MPILQHQSFQPPSDESAVIWRYMDFAKFIFLLDSKKLFFPSLANLNETDKFEGWTGTRFSGLAELSFEDNLKMHDPKMDGIQITDQTTFDGLKNAIAEYRTSAEKAKDIIYVNCWHLNKTEDAAMWDRYLKKEHGIAIKSSYAALIKSFQNTPEIIHAGKIQYLNHEQYDIDFIDIHMPAMHKTDFYSSENELRLFYCPYKGLPEQPAMHNGGLALSIDLDELITEIVFSPSASGWFKSLVKTMLNRYALEKPTRSSALDRNCDAN